MCQPRTQAHQRGGEPSSTVPITVQLWHKGYSRTREIETAARALQSPETTPAQRPAEPGRPHPTTASKRTGTAPTQATMPPTQRRCREIEHIYPRIAHEQSAKPAVFAYSGPVRPRLSASGFVPPKHTRKVAATPVQRQEQRSAGGIHGQPAHPPCAGPEKQGEREGLRAARALVKLSLKGPILLPSPSIGNGMGFSFKPTELQ